MIPTDRLLVNGRGRLATPHNRTVVSVASQVFEKFFIRSFPSIFSFCIRRFLLSTRNCCCFVAYVPDRCFNSVRMSTGWLLFLWLLTSSLSFGPNENYCASRSMCRRFPKTNCDSIETCLWYEYCGWAFCATVTWHNLKIRDNWIGFPVTPTLGLLSGVFVY